jgi:hypothetical protein
MVPQPFTDLTTPAAIRSPFAFHLPDLTLLTSGKSIFDFHRYAMSLSDFRPLLCFSPLFHSPRNGRWRSAWTATFKSGGTVAFNGTVKLNVHYYEDGNVQLSGNFTKTASFAGPSDPKAFAEALAKQLFKMEQDYHNSLEQSYSVMGETTFKALRRVLPITRQKMQWDKTAAMRVGAEIGRT